MGNEESDKKFTWVIKNFSSLESVRIIRSKNFVIGGCKWYLVAYPKGYENEIFSIFTTTKLSLFLVLAGEKTLPCGWRCKTSFRLTVVNQLSEKLSKRRETQCWFDPKSFFKGYFNMIPIWKLHSKEGGFIVDNEVKIVVELDVLEVIDKLDVPEESQEVTQLMKRKRLNDDVNETIDVNGFQVLPSQVESVKHIFGKHPDMALKFQIENQHLRTSAINVLVSLIKTLCQSLQDLSTNDMGQAEKALTYLKDSGLKVDWLERKLEEVKEKKMEEQIGKTRMQKLEEELKGFKQMCSDREVQLEKGKEELKDLQQKCSDIEALLEKEKANVLAAGRSQSSSSNVG